MIPLFSVRAAGVANHGNGLTTETGYTNKQKRRRLILAGGATSAPAGQHRRTQRTPHPPPKKLTAALHPNTQVQASGRPEARHTHTTETRMGCYEVVCQECGETHIDGSEISVLSVRKAIWVREGASNVAIPLILRGNYDGYGNFVPLDDALAAKVVFCDLTTTENCDVEEILKTRGMSDSAEYLVSVVASSLSCLLDEAPAAAVAVAPTAAAALLMLDKRGRTPLHLACMRNPPDLEVIQVLMEAGPGAARIVDYDGKRPIDYARENGAPPELLALL